MKKFFDYENSLLIILFLTFGLVFMDRLSFNFLMPFIAKDLGFSFTESGLVLGVLSFFFGLSTLIFSSISDLTGSKKKWLIAFVLMFSTATLSVGLIRDVNSMIVIRAIMGITEGPVIPLVLAIVLAESSVNRRGLNMGLVKGSGPLMSGVLAPMILIPIAVVFHWKYGFYTLALPGFILAAILWKFMREPEFSQAGETEQKPSFAELKQVFKNRNILLCILISIFFQINLSTFLGFAPLYLDSVLQYEAGKISTFMTVFGLFGFIWFFTIPWISDKFGRKPTLLFFAFTSILLPIAFAFLNDNFIMLLVIIAVLTCGVGYMPLFDAVIPAESIPHKYAATAMAGTVLTGEAIGATFGPIIGGIFADMFDLHAPFWVGALGAGIAFLLAFGIQETAPVKKGQVITSKSGS